MHKRTVGEAMTASPIVLSPEVTVERAVELAAARTIHHMLVACEDGLVRVLCLCDLLGRQALEDALENLPRVPDRRRVGDVAHRRTYVVGPDDDLDEASEIMQREGIGCLPVVEGGEIVGVLTRVDLCKTGRFFDAILDLRCASCGTTNDVRRLEPGGAGFCPACWARAGAPQGDEEIGVGD